jgi:hypothetical protein
MLGYCRARIHVTLSTRIYKGGQAPPQNITSIPKAIQTTKQDVGYYAHRGPNLSKPCVACTFEFLISASPCLKLTTSGTPLGGQAVKYRHIGYLKDKVGIGSPVSRFLGRLEGVCIVGRKTFIDKNFKGVQQAHYSILQHLTIMTPLVDQHLSMIRAKSNGCSDDWIMREHKHRLTAWLKDLDLPDGKTVEQQTIKRLAASLSSQVTSWQGYDINIYLFYTALKDKKTMSQNNDVHIEALDERTCKSTTYYDIIDDIWEVYYGSNIQIRVFQCCWVKHPRGVEVNGYGLMIVDLSNVGYKDDSWVLASQVAYVADPAKKTKHVVISGKQDIKAVDGIDDVEEYN